MEKISPINCPICLLTNVKKLEWNEDKSLDSQPEHLEVLLNNRVFFSNIFLLLQILQVRKNASSSAGKWDDPTKIRRNGDTRYSKKKDTYSKWSYSSLMRCCRAEDLKGVSFVCVQCSMLAVSSIPRNGTYSMSAIQRNENHHHHHLYLEIFWKTSAFFLNWSIAWSY